MNFLKEYTFGQSGGNKGLNIGPGLEKLNKAINGLQKKMMIGVASAPKIGKSTFVDYAFIIHPWLHSLELGPEKIDFRVIYLSFEMDRITKEFDFAVYFLYHDYGIKGMKLPEGVTYNNVGGVPLSSDLLRGRVQDDSGEIIKLSKALEEKMKEVYENRIIPLFGEYNEDGKKIKPGVIVFEEHIENPTGLYNKLLGFAGSRGVFSTSTFVNSSGQTIQTREGYTPNNPNEFIVVVIDTVRKVAPERGFSLKQAVDKMLEYCTILKKLCGYTFIPIVHINRDMATTTNLTFMKDRVHPQPEFIKDTGNLSEECNHLITLFNPYDDRYNLNSHFGHKLRLPSGEKAYPNLRTVHLVESRQVVYPQHFRVQMEGNIKNFNQL